MNERSRLRTSLILASGVLAILLILTALLSACSAMGGGTGGTGDLRGGGASNALYEPPSPVQAEPTPSPSPQIERAPDLPQ